MGKTFKDKEKFWRKERLRKDTNYPNNDYSMSKRKKLNKKDYENEDLDFFDNSHSIVFN